MKPRLLVVTGLSGAGRSSALKILEDEGFEAVDNLPLPLLERLVRGDEELDGDLAVGMDSRTRGFGSKKLVALMRRLAGRSFEPHLVFLECDDEVLLRRYTETRRRHPMALDRPIADGIARERRLMREARAAADVPIDTSRLSLAELKRLLQARFGRRDERRMTISLVSFAFREGLPREADMVFDVRFLRNPHYDDALRPLTGLDGAVQEHVAADPAFAPFFEGVTGLLLLLLPRYLAEGKSYLTIAIGCTGGKHRSVFTVERLASRLRGEDWEVMTLHRELSPSRRENAS